MLQLLGLQTLPDFVNLVDGAATLADLVHDVLDLVGEGLVLPADFLELEHSLLVGRLDLEQLRGGVASLLLADVKVEGQTVNLALPLANDLVKLLGLPIHGSVEDLGLVEAVGHVAALRSNLGLGLLNLVQLGVQVVNGSLSLRQSCGQFHLGHLELLALGYRVGLILLAPALCLTLSLGSKAENVLTAGGLLIEGLTCAVKLVLQVAVLSKEQTPLASLVVAESLYVVELGRQSGLLLGQDVQVVVKISNDAEKVRVLNGNLVLGGCKVTESQVGIVNLLVDGVESLQHGLVGLVGGGLGPHDLVSGGAGVGNLIHDLALVLLNLALHFSESINLLRHLSNGIALLPLQVSKNGLLLDVGLFHILAELVHLCVPLLVKFNLGSGGTAGLILALSLQFLLHGLNTALDLLDSLLGLCHEVLLVIELGGQLGVVLVLVANHNLKVTLCPLELSNTILRHLEVTLNLPLGLLKCSPALLLFVESTLQLIKSGFKLALHGVQVSDLLIDGDHVVVGLGLGLSNVLLFLVELVDNFILFGNLVLEHLDGVIAVTLLKLNLGNSELDVLNFLLDDSDAPRVSLHLGGQLNPGGLLRREDGLGVLELGLSSCLSCSRLCLPVGVHRDVTLLFSQLLAHGLDLVLEGVHAATEVGGDLQSLLVLSPGLIGLLLQDPQFLLWVRLPNESTSLLDENKPSPVSAGQILAEVPLSNLDQLPLVKLLLVDESADPLQHLTLDEAHPLDDQFVALLLKTTERTSTEEDKGVSQPVPLTVERNAIHESIDGGLVVFRGLDGILSEARVPQLEVGVEHPVGESAHADPDSLEHTVASQLLHDEWGLHLAGLLVGVGHQAADKVGLAVVQGRHEFAEGDQVDRGHGLAAALLLLLSFLLGRSGW